MFLPNERALEPQIAAIYRRFGLNDRQIEILSRATPKRDYYCQSRRGNRLFELGLSRSRARLHRRIVKDRPDRHRRDPRRPRPRRLRRRLAAPQGPRLGGRHAHPQPGDFIMITRRLRAGLIAGVAALSIAAVSVPAHAQWIVFDPDQLRAEHPDRRARAAAGQQ